MEVNKLGKMMPFGNKDTHGLSLLVLGLFVWWTGLAGRDLYLAPVLGGILIMAYNVLCTKSFNNIFGNSDTIMTLSLIHI